MQQIYLHEFITTIFQDLLPGETIAMSQHVDDSWLQRSYDEVEDSYAHGAAAWYYAMATTDGERDGKKLLRKGHNMRHAYSLVLDDIGTGDGSKAVQEPTVEPNWKIETSEGNYQWGYLIEPFDISTPEGLGYWHGVYQAMHDAWGVDMLADSSRVLRVPGSVNVKEGRDNFVSTITHWDPTIRTSLEDLAEDMGLGEIDATPRSIAKRREPLAPDEIDAMFDGDIWLQWLAENGRVIEQLPDKVAIRCFGEHETPDDTSTVYFPGGNFNCFHATCEHHDGNWLREQIVAAGGPGEPKPRDFPASLDKLFEGAKSINTVNEDQENLEEDTSEPGHSDATYLLMASETAMSEDHVGLLCVQEFEGRYLYPHGGDKQWLAWDGHRWAVDEGLFLQRNIIKFLRPTNRTRTATKRSFVDNVAKMMQLHDKTAALFSAFDSDNYKLNTPGGTVDLRTGNMLHHNPKDLITHCTRVAPGGVVAHRFAQFMDEITDGDQELQDFLQVALGAMLSGAIEAHWLMFWAGGGRNGKNTLGDLVSWIMNDYATTIASDTLMHKDKSEHPAEMMQMKGKRLVTSSEIHVGAKWNESRINSVTGDPTISARYMNGNWVNYPRTHKHLIYGNHRPALENLTPAIRARIKIVPFNVSFIGREDPELGNKLQAEAGGVLTWLIRGHARWLALGKKLPPCKAVDTETADYFGTQVTFDNWLKECTVAAYDVNAPLTHFTLAGKLLESYNDWRGSQDAKPVNKMTFADSLRGYEKVATKRGAVYRGLKLSAESGPGSPLPKTNNNQSNST